MNYKKALSLGIMFTFLSSNVVFAADIIKKDESVFITLDSKGNHRETIVSDWLHSDNPNVEIKDKSNLKSVVNVKGTETPLNENGFLVWKSDNKDIFYQGTSENPIPIDVNITYYLEGKEINPENLAGKSGRVKMKIDFKNMENHVSVINGKSRTLYTPITAVAVINLPLDKFSEVTSSSGELISDGNNQILTFIGFPGLRESLDLDRDIVDLPDSLTIEASVKNFEMGPVMITATPKIPEVKGFEDAKTIDELINGVNQLQDAASKLSEGTGKIAEGEKALSDNLQSLNGGLEKLNSASKELKAGSEKLSNGTEALSEGAKSLSEGSKALNGGLNQLAEKSSELSTGLNQLAGSTSQIKNGQNDLTNGAKELVKGIEQLKSAKNKELLGVNALSSGVDLLMDIAKLIPDGDIKNNLLKGLEGQKSGLNQLAQGGTDYLKGLDNLEAGAKKLQGGSEALSSYLGQLEEGQKKAVEGGIQLAQGSSYIYSKSSELSEGAGKLNIGIGELGKGAKTLNSGVMEYTAGVSAASAGSSQLSEGALKLMAGVNELDVNMKKFRADGIDKMTNTVKDKVSNIDELIAAKDEIIRLSKNYGTYTGLSDGMEGTVKFIMKTDEIKVKEVKADTSKEVKAEHKGFIEWIRGIFKK